MKTNIFIDACELLPDDIEYLNSNADEKDVTFSLINTKKLLSPEFIIILIELAKNIGYSAAYDMLKFSLSKIIGIFSKKNPKGTKKFEIVCNQNKYSLTCDFPLTQEQQDKLIDAAIKKFIEE
ncbi:MAG: hypothetical protein ACLUV3_06385 [Oscillospiraceae bacterium]